MSDRRRLLVIAAILLGSAGLRLLQLDSQGLFFDEAWSWAAARLDPGGLYHLARSDPHPPLYYLLLKLHLLVVPDTHFGLRLLSAAFSVASLGLVLFYTSRRWGLETTLYVGLLAGLSPFDIYYAQEARMYTLLACLWVASYLALAKALAGERYCWRVWPLPAILMAWTHFYGVIVAYVLAGAAVWLGRQGDQTRGDGRTPSAPTGCGGGEGGVTPPRLRWAAAAVVALGALPPLVLALANASQNAGGAWVPAGRDLVALFTLASAGLAPVRTFFLDSTHLVLTGLAALPLWAWLAAGLAVSGLPAVWGLVSTWRRETGRRAEALLAVILLTLPTALVFGYGALTARPVWALKPFLGAAWLGYLWAGVGIGAVRHALLRRGLGAAAALLALASLWPYYTTWQKSDAARAFQSLPAPASQAGVIVQPLYQSPLAFYYLGETVPVYGLAAQAGEAYGLFRVMPPTADGFGQREPLVCGALPPAADLWVYGAVDRIRQASLEWPACVTGRRLWVYQDGEWRLLTEG